MRRKNNKKKFLFILLILFIGIGFSYISTNLQLRIDSSFGSGRFNVYFDDLNIIYGDEHFINTPVINNDLDTISYNVDLFLPGDEISFIVDVVNDGTVDAMIKVIDTSNLSDSQKEYFEYTLTYDDGVPIEEYNLLKVDERDTIYVSVKYKDDIDLDTFTSNKESIDFSLSLDYRVSEKNAFLREKEYTKLLYGKGLNVKMKRLAGMPEYSFNDIDEYVEYFYDEDNIIAYDGTTCTNIDTSTGNSRTVNVSRCRTYRYELIEAYGNAHHDQNIEYIKRSYEYPTEIVEYINTHEDWEYNLYIANGEESDKPIYMWYDETDKTIYYYSESKMIYTDSDPEYMFVNFDNLLEINLERVSGKFAVATNYMFAGCRNLEVINAYFFDTRNVEYMAYMFDGCRWLRKFNDNLFKTNNVVDMSYMFGLYNGLKWIDFNKLDTSNVENMEGVFALSNAESADSINIDSWDTSNVTTMVKMFDRCYLMSNEDLERIVRNFDTSNVEYFDEMFYSFKCSDEYILNLNFDYSSMISNENMFGEVCPPR